MIPEKFWQIFTFRGQVAENLSIANAHNLRAVRQLGRTPTAIFRTVMGLFEGCFGHNREIGGRDCYSSGTNIGTVGTEVVL